MDIPTLAKTIATQTGVEYSLNMQNTSLHKKIKLKPGKWSLEDVMREVQEQVGLNYKFIGDHILFTDYRPAKKEDTVVIVKKAKPIEEIPAVVEVEVEVDTPMTPRQTYVMDLIFPDYLSILEVGRGTIETRAFVEAQMEIERLALQRELLYKKPRWYKPYTFIGGQINEITYLNIVAKAGLQYFYTIGMVGANLKGVRFMYGAGIRLPMEKDNNSLHLEFINSWLNRHSKDTLVTGVISEHYFTIGLSWSRYVSPRMFIQIEANYSRLQKYNGIDNVSMESVEHGLIRFGNLMYTTQRTYNSELNKWPGFRLSLFYNLSEVRTH